MRDQFDGIKPPFLRYIRENINNYEVDIVIDLNEEETVKYAYTPQEKYLKLKEKNNNLELLKRAFNLDF